MVEAYFVVLADDHAMFRQGVRRILEELPGVQIVGEAQDGLQLLDLLKTTKPHLVILDISMPHLRGVEAAREIKTLHPRTKILMLTMHKESEYLYFAMKAGVDGFLLKEDADSELVLALEAIRQGKMYISPLLSEQLPDLLAQQYRRRGVKELSEPLTDREKQVLKLIAEGKSSKEIGKLLFISARTVQNHRANIMKKLNLKKTTDLVRYAVQKGFL
jgi:DNA-binding NarL/FixJ family response regulator